MGEKKTIITMSTKKCPRCKSTDTRLAYGNIAEKTLKVVATIGTALLFHGSAVGNAGHVAAHHAANESVKTHHCNRCGHEW